MGRHDEGAVLVSRDDDRVGAGRQLGTRVLLVVAPEVRLEKVSQHQLCGVFGEVFQGGDLADDLSNDGVVRGKSGTACETLSGEVVGSAVAQLRQAASPDHGVVAATSHVLHLVALEPLDHELLVGPRVDQLARVGITLIRLILDLRARDGVDNGH